MTVCIAAYATDGIVFATDSAVTMAESRVTLPYIKGFEHPNEGFVLWAGHVHKIREVEEFVTHEGHDIFTAIKEINWKKSDDAEFLIYDPEHGLCMADKWLATVACEEWGAIGHGAEAARMLMEALYKKRGCHYVETTLKTIIKIIQKYDTSVYGPVRTMVWQHE